MDTTKPRVDLSKDGEALNLDTVYLDDGLAIQYLLDPRDLYFKAYHRCNFREAEDIFKNDYPVLEGSIRWDHCMNFRTLRGGHWAHVCGEEDLVEITRILYTLAKPILMK